MFGRTLGPWEIGAILLIVIIVFGVGKLPQVGNALGKAIRSFKQGQTGDDSEEEVEEVEKNVASTKSKKTTNRKNKKL